MSTSGTTSPPSPASPTAYSAALAKADPADAAAFRKNATAFKAELTPLEAKEARIKKEHGGEAVAITEPVPLYMTEASGLVNRTPAAFSEAIERATTSHRGSSRRVWPCSAAGRSRLLVYNEQTSEPADREVRGGGQGGRHPRRARHRDPAEGRGLPRLDDRQRRRARERAGQVDPGVRAGRHSCRRSARRGPVVRRPHGVERPRPRRTVRGVPGRAGAERSGQDQLRTGAARPSAAVRRDADRPRPARSRGRPAHRLRPAAGGAVRAGPAARPGPRAVRHRRAPLRAAPAHRRGPPPGGRDPRVGRGRGLRRRPARDAVRR
ncbi:hypothetical protein SVIOM74S_10203 [Streptomyces violarus]